MYDREILCVREILYVYVTERKKEIYFFVYLYDREREMFWMCMTQRERKIDTLCLESLYICMTERDT